MFEVFYESFKSLELKREVRAGHINVGLVSIGMVFKARIPGRWIRVEKRGGPRLERWARQHVEVRRRKGIGQRLSERSRAGELGRNQQSTGARKQGVSRKRE